MIEGTENPGGIYDVEAICKENAGCTPNYDEIIGKYGLGYIFKTS